MDHEFIRDITGQCVAKMSMGHEALGSWLTDEAGHDVARCDAVLADVDALLRGELDETQYTGQAFRLYLDQDAATVSALELQFQTDLGDEPGLSYYDDELFATCGLDDFQLLLRDWRAFISEK